MQRYSVFMGVILVVFLATKHANAEIAVIDAAKDNTLYESTTGSLSNGAGQYFFVGRTGQLSGSIRRGLLQFDIAAAIPSGSTINSVVLRLNLSRVRIATNKTINIHRALADWGESTSDAAGQEGPGAPASAGDATWLHTFHNTDFWTTAGGDFSGAVQASTIVTNLGPYSWGSTPELVADVQSWLDSPASNFGWVILGNETIGTTAARFDTRESLVEGNRPALTVDFTLPVAMGACCNQLTGSCVDDVEVEFCLGVNDRFGGVDSTCTTLDPPCQPSGACCNELIGVCTDLVLESDCTGPGLRYGGDASDCATIDPQCTPPPTGACCLESSGGCAEDLTALECSGRLGRFAGNGSTCSTASPACQASVSISLELVAGGVANAKLNAGSGLTAPVFLTHASDGSGRLFIVDQIGHIRIVKDGTLLPTPFLDLTSKIITINPFFDERGVLGLAFHPDYANNGRFFVRYSAPRAGDPAEPCNNPEGFVVGCHAETVAEFTVSADPDVGDLSSEIILFQVDEPQFNHDAGQILFGPDGLLYFTLGDGGGANDGLADDPPSHGPIGNGQNISTTLGSLLRIDIDGTPDPGLDYKIPPGNPFAGGGGAPEIYAYGFRNPYRFTFAKIAGVDIAIVGDVGQNLFEEIDFVPILPAPGLLNFGWVIREGFQCFDPMAPTSPPATCATVGASSEPLLDPVVDYPHPTSCMEDIECVALGTFCNGEGFCNNPAGIAVIGGYVYQGSNYPALAGKYLFGDFGQSFVVPGGRLFYMDVEGADAFNIREAFIAPDGAPLGQALLGIGEDEGGELYILAADNIGPSGTGFVYRIVPPQPASRGLSPRYLEVTPPPGPQPYAIAVTPDCPTGATRYLAAPSGDDNYAKLVDVPTELTSLEWGSPVRVFGTTIVPDTSYLVQTDFGAQLSPATSATTALHGDVAGLENGVFLPPDGAFSFVVDVVAVVQAFAGAPSAPPIYQTDLAGSGVIGIECLPDQEVSIITDVIIALDAFQGGDGSALNCPAPCP